uniref:Mitochondrial inner membrane protein OXA1 n=1 Tax=Aegilops tauschii TaxID=37682 RepID=M8BIQ5_AEGTA
MALPAAARRSLASRGLSGPLARRLHRSLPQLLPSNSTGDPRKPSPLPPPPAPRPFHFALAPRGTSQTLSFPPFGLHLLPGPSRRSFSSSRDTGFSDTLADAAHSAASAAAPASFPGEVAWAAEDSSMAVAAVQHLIDAVHSFTGLNWSGFRGLRNLSPLPCLQNFVSGGFLLLSPQCCYAVGCSQFRRLSINDYMLNPTFFNASNLYRTKGEKSIQELADAADPMVRKLGFLPTLHIIVTPYTFITLYIAISNMVEKVPSLKGGGALWFTDLTTPDALCIFPMITSLFIMLRFEVNYGVAAKRTERSRKMEDNIRQVVRATSLLPMLWTATLPQPEHPQNKKAISCSLVAWSGLTLAGKIVLKHPDVQKVLYGGPFLLKQECSASDGQKGPTAEDSPPPVKEEEEPVSPETKKSSDASVHRDESDKKSTKDG